MLGGESQYLVLWINKDGKMTLHRADDWPVGDIGLGHWKITLQLTASNFEGFESTLGFTYSRGEGIAYDGGVRRFSMQRQLPPRFPSTGDASDLACQG
jgi:hypothetical protein